MSCRQRVESFQALYWAEEGTTAGGTAIVRPPVVMSDSMVQCVFRYPLVSP